MKLASAVMSFVSSVLGLGESSTNTLEDARLLSRTSPREGRAGVPPLQATAEKCSANRGWDSPLSELF